MQRKLLNFGTALTAVALFLNATTAPAAAGGYDGKAALINTYIQSSPWTSTGGYSGYSGYAGWSDTGYIVYKPWSGSTVTIKPWTDGHYTPTTVYKPWTGASYVGTYGHGSVSYYDGHGGPVIYGDPAFAKVTTIVSPTLSYDYGDPVLHVGKHAVDIADPVFFEFGSAMLTDPAKTELDQIGRIVSAWYFDNPKVLIMLSGFTDATGSPSANAALAKARNATVRDYLIAEFGFDAARFVMRAVGEDYANMSATPYDEHQRKVTVSLIGLPTVVEAPATVPPHTHETTAMTGTAPAMAAEKGGEMVPVDETGMAVAPAPKPVPAPVVAVQSHVAEPVMQTARCIVPNGPYAATYVDGKVLATVFTDIDDYGGGKLVEVCGLAY